MEEALHRSTPGPSPSLSWKRSWASSTRHALPGCADRVGRVPRLWQAGSRSSRSAWGYLLRAATSRQGLTTASSSSGRTATAATSTAHLATDLLSVKDRTKAGPFHGLCRPATVAGSLEGHGASVLEPTWSPKAEGASWKPAASSSATSPPPRTKGRKRRWATSSCRVPCERGAGLTDCVIIETNRRFVCQKLLDGLEEQAWPGAAEGGLPARDVSSKRSQAVLQRGRPAREFIEGFTSRRGRPFTGLL